MTRSDRRTYWEHHLAGWRECGLSQRAYCEAQGVNVWSFYRWCRRLAPSEPSGARFMPVRLAATQG